MDDNPTVAMKAPKSIFRSTGTRSTVLIMDQVGSEAIICRGVGTQQSKMNQADDGHDGDQRKNAGQSHPASQKWSDEKSGPKGQTDTGSQSRIGPRADLWARQIGNQGKHGAADSPGPLQQSRDNHPIDVFNEYSHGTAQNKQAEPQGNHGFSANSITPDAKGNLQTGLRERIGSQRQSNQQRRGSLQVQSQQAENGDDQKKSEHSEKEDATQAIDALFFKIRKNRFFLGFCQCASTSRGLPEEGSGS